SAPLHGSSLVLLALVCGLGRAALLRRAWKLLYLCRKRGAVQDVALDEVAVACGLHGLFLEADGGLAITALSLAGGQLPRQQVPFLEGPPGRPQGRFEGMRLLGEKGFGMKGVADVTAEAHQRSLVHLPEIPTALRAGENGDAAPPFVADLLF